MQPVQLSNGETMLPLGGDTGLIARQNDPVISPQPYSSPADFATQYPTPLDTTEIIAMCEEVTMLQALPEEETALKEHTWRELNSLAFTSGSAYISFADGVCPEEYTHDGSNTTVTLKNVGAKKSLTYSDIKHSMAVAAANWNGINQLVGGVPWGEGVPGGSDMASFQVETVRDVKEKEARLAMTLVLNGWDNLLVNGDSSSNSLEFDGIVTTVTSENGAHTNSSGASGAFSGQSYDQFLAEGCAKPTTLVGHPQAIQEVMSAYFALGFNGSQVVNFSNGSRITPGYNFDGYVNTGVGRLEVIADANFPRVASGATTFQSTVYSLRKTHNGTPLVYKLHQFPLSFRDLMPGCTAVQFEVWAKTALIIKHVCAHGAYTSLFTGGIVTTCPVIG
jgi:hypothetical protein